MTIYYYDVTTAYALRRKTVEWEQRAVSVSKVDTHYSYVRPVGPGRLYGRYLRVSKMHHKSDDNDDTPYTAQRVTVNFSTAALL